MKILNRRSKWRAAVVISLHREDVPAEGHLGHAHNKPIGKIAAGDQQISPQLPIKINLFFVRYNQCSHANTSGKTKRVEWSPAPLLISNLRAENICGRFRGNEINAFDPWPKKWTRARRS